MLECTTGKQTQVVPKVQVVSQLIQYCKYLGRVKLLSAAGSAAVLSNAIKENWRLARKILLQFKLSWFLNVFGNTLLAILHLGGNSKKLLPAALSNLTRPCIDVAIKIQVSDLVNSVKDYSEMKVTAALQACHTEDARTYV